MKPTWILLNGTFWSRGGQFCWSIGKIPKTIKWIFTHCNTLIFLLGATGLSELDVFDWVWSLLMMYWIFSFQFTSFWIVDSKLIKLTILKNNRFDWFDPISMNVQLTWLFWSKMIQPNIFHIVNTDGTIRRNFISNLMSFTVFQMEMCINKCVLKYNCQLFYVWIGSDRDRRKSQEKL